MSAFPVEITAGGEERPLTQQELEALAREYSAYTAWHAVRAFALQTFGERAEKITLELYEDGAPGGRSAVKVVTIFAEDGQGEPLQFDLALPFWRERREEIASAFLELDGVNEGDQEAMDEAWQSACDEYLLLGEVNAFVAHHLPTRPEMTVFTLSAPPTLSFPRVSRAA